jgi:hypothetical protein
MHRSHRVQCAAVSTIGVLLRLQVRLENRLQHDQHRGLRHAILGRRYAQRPLLSVRLGDVMLSKDCPSTPGAPPLIRQCRQAVHKTSFRYTLSYNA